MANLLTACGQVEINISVAFSFSQLSPIIRPNMSANAILHSIFFFFFFFFYTLWLIRDAIRCQKKRLMRRLARARPSENTDSALTASESPGRRPKEQQMYVCVRGDTAYTKHSLQVRWCVSGVCWSGVAQSLSTRALEKKIIIKRVRRRSEYTKQK